MVSLRNKRVKETLSALLPLEHSHLLFPNPHSLQLPSSPSSSSSYVSSSSHPISLLSFLFWDHLYCFGLRVLN
ncbi:hypothetical protein RIF29_19883 [Crotalaria pallida]|uniref:Uncharacterized protein n=1 Tax=Crotalaria pallida TaxID=3830 RepID=A0AAN9I4I9_CROPI